MRINQNIYILFLTVFQVFGALAQDSKLQTLAQLYEQGYYKMVYRKASRLQMNPAYDKRKEPAKYRQLAAQELAKNPRWAKRHALELEWSADSQKEVNNAVGAQTLQSKQVKKLIQDANAQLGVPYKWAGTDPNGFDCSGFTCYVFEASGIQLPRKASDQFIFCTPIDPAQAQAGDLVFFSNGEDVNHVGILISDKGAPKEMIHASSSLGISIVNIDTSTYWQTRVIGFGRVKVQP